MLKRHEVQVLRRAGHTWKEIAALSGVSVRTVRRITAEADITTIDNAAERARRQVGRPSKADEYRDVLVQALTEEPTLRSVELLHRAVAVFDRPKTVALKWGRDGVVTEWNATLPAWRWISGSGLKCAGRIGRKRKGVSRIWSAG